jgi:hypothetical protein
LTKTNGKTVLQRAVQEYSPAGIRHDERGQSRPATKADAQRTSGNARPADESRDCPQKP